MVTNSPVSLDIVFSALSDPTRRAILERLAQSQATVMELTAPFEFKMSRPAISKHLSILEHAGLIVREKEGRVHHLRLAAIAMKEATEWLEYYRHFWDEQLDNLTAYMSSTPDQKRDGAIDESTGH